MPDVFDVAQANEERSRDIALSKVVGALKGQGREDCEDCGEDIPDERRKAVPSATRCIGCQQRFERSTR